MIDPDSESITVHVRAMSAGGVFTGSHRDDFRGNTFIKLDLPASRTPGPSSRVLRRLDEAVTAVGERRHEEALALIADVSLSRSPEKRRIEIEALRGLGKQQQLIEVLDPPQNVDEAIELIAMLLDAGRFDDARDRLRAARPLLTSNVFTDLKATIIAREIPE